MSATNIRSNRTASATSRSRMNLVACNRSRPELSTPPLALQLASATAPAEEQRHSARPKSAAHGLGLCQPKWPDKQSSVSTLSDWLDQKLKNHFLNIGVPGHCEGRSANKIFKSCRAERDPAGVSFQWRKFGASAPVSRRDLRRWSFLVRR